jgi:hypothetical protein
MVEVKGLSWIVKKTRDEGQQRARVGDTAGNLQGFSMLFIRPMNVLDSSHKTVLQTNLDPVRMGGGFG